MVGDGEEHLRPADRFHGTFRRRVFMGSPAPYRRHVSRAARGSRIGCTRRPFYLCSLPPYFVLLVLEVGEALVCPSESGGSSACPGCICQGVQAPEPTQLQG